MTNRTDKKDSGQLFVISAPSGAGKTSLVSALMKSATNIGVAISHTTRPKRPEETDGVNYHFANEASFRSMVDRGEFLEWATVFDNLYGTSTQAVSHVLNEGKNLILEIDWQGAAQVRKKIPDAQSIFIFPPSLAALRDRLVGRAQDDPETVEKRLAAAFTELSHWNDFDYLIVNDDFDTALNQLMAVVEHQDQNQHKRHQQLALGPLIKDLLPQ